MSVRKFAAAAALGVSALGLSACATGLSTQVSRYQAAAIVPGQTFYVVPQQGAPDNRFYRYAAMISQQLQAQGFRPAGAPQAADMLVRVDYGVDEGRTEIVDNNPFGYGPHGRYGGWGLGPYGYGYGGFYGQPYYSRWGRNPFYYGWNDPFWYRSGFGSDIRAYTVYKSRLDMDIVRRADGAPLFEGHAQARSGTEELDALVPSLVTAMFTGFPGRSGETVRITVPPAPPRS